MLLKSLLQGSEMPTPPLPPEDYLNQLLSFLYTFAHWIGQMVVNLLDNFLNLSNPSALIDPIGFLALITGLLIVAEVAKRIAWLILVAGWVLIVLKVVLDAVASQ